MITVRRSQRRRVRLCAGPWTRTRSASHSSARYDRVCRICCIHPAMHHMQNPPACQTANRSNMSDRTRTQTRWTLTRLRQRRFSIHRQTRTRVVKMKQLRGNRRGVRRARCRNTRFTLRIHRCDSSYLREVRCVCRSCLQRGTKGVGLGYSARCYNGSQVSRRPQRHRVLLRVIDSTVLHQSG